MGGGEELRSREGEEGRGGQQRPDCQIKGHNMAESTVTLHRASGESSSNSSRLWEQEVLECTTLPPCDWLIDFIYVDKRVNVSWPLSVLTASS